MMGEHLSLQIDVGLSQWPPYSQPPLKLPQRFRHFILRLGICVCNRPLGSSNASVKGGCIGVWFIEFVSLPCNLQRLVFQQIMSCSALTLLPGLRRVLTCGGAHTCPCVPKSWEAPDGEEVQDPCLCVLSIHSRLRRFTELKYLFQIHALQLGIEVAENGFKFCPPLRLGEPLIDKDWLRLSH